MSNEARKLISLLFSKTTVWCLTMPYPASNDTPILDGRNILRPETVESLFLAYRLTGDRLYREQGWQIFQSFQKHCKVPGGGYAGIANVEDADDVEQLDKMETFWLSETLSECGSILTIHCGTWLTFTLFTVEYLYLLFSDGDTVPLSDNVFNTEVSRGQCIR